MAERHSPGVHRHTARVPSLPNPFPILQQGSGQLLCSRNREGVGYWLCRRCQHPSGWQQHRKQLPSARTRPPWLHHLGPPPRSHLRTAQIRIDAPDSFSKAIQHGRRRQPGGYHQGPTTNPPDTRHPTGPEAPLGTTREAHSRKGNTAKPGPLRHHRIHLGSHL